MRILKVFRWLLPVVVFLACVLPAGLVSADSPSIDNVRVFQSYKVAGDWLIVGLYNNSVAPYYNLSDVTEYWDIQLIDENGVAKTSNHIANWGMRPFGTYISTATANALEWGNLNYSVRMQSLYNASLSVNLSIDSPSFWVGSDMTKLDSWVIYTARTMAAYDRVAYTFDSAKWGTVPNSLGGNLFMEGIADLSNVRPNIFMYTINNMPTGNTTPVNNSYAGSLDDWQISIGPELTNALTSNAAILGTTGRTLGGMLIFIEFVALAALAVAMGHFAAGIALASLMLIGGTIIGLIPLPIILAFAAICLVIAVFKLIITQS